MLLEKYSFVSTHKKVCGLKEGEEPIKTPLYTFQFPAVYTPTRRDRQAIGGIFINPFCKKRTERTKTDGPRSRLDEARDRVDLPLLEAFSEPDCSVTGARPQDEDVRSRLHLGPTANDRRHDIDRVRGGIRQVFDGTKYRRAEDRDAGDVIQTTARRRADAGRHWFAVVALAGFDDNVGHIRFCHHIGDVDSDTEGVRTTVDDSLHGLKPHATQEQVVTHDPAHCFLWQESMASNRPPAIP